ncbi:MAG: hypothetical protein JWO63_1282 [Frankiales bacterium]|jgi:hypothetical protein|nr:hypothetical protein [Frankiales bacterium]
MTKRPTWTYSGAVPLIGDLSALESELHTGRIEAVELGYRAEPDSIDVQEAMLVGEDHLISAEEAEAQGVPFVPTHTRFIMSWPGES